MKPAVSSSTLASFFAALAAASGLAFTLAACSGTGTSLLLEVDTAQLPGVQQLHVSGRVGDALVFGPAIRPERAADALRGMQTVRVLLPDDADGKAVKVRVEGLIDGESRGAAEAEAHPRKGREVPVALALEPIAAPCVGCAGCCRGGRCIDASVAACGAGGVACFACNPWLSDHCAPAGRCACGGGPACSPLTGADRCIDGACRCGNGPACPSGTECDNGVCRCTTASCAGCCANNECLPGTAPSACGSGGVTCSSCEPDRSCSAGECVSG